VVLEATQVEPNRWLLRKDGVLLTPDMVDASKLSNRRSLNVALLGVLSRHLDIPDADWLASLQSNLAPNLFDANQQAFLLGRQS
jgi:indolepyruvate ferredoxin oxidoreductase beta subunit